MSQVVINANAESFVEKILTTDPAKVQSLTYKTAKTFPNVSKSIIEKAATTSFTGDFSNNTDIFEINQSDMLSGLRLKFTGVKPTSLTTVLKGAYAAENFINTLTLMMNGSPLQALSGPAIKAYYEDSPASVQEFHYRYALPLRTTNEKPFTDAATDATTFVTYLGIPSYFFDAVFRNPYLKDTDIFSVQILYNSTAQAGFDEAFTSLTTKLQVIKWRGDDTTMKMIKDVDYSNNQYRLGWSTQTEQQVLTDTTSLSWTCQAKYANFKLYPMIVRTSTAANAAGGGAVYGCPKLPISKVTLQMGDEYFVYNFSKSMVNYENAMRGASGSHKITNSNGTATLVYDDEKNPCIEFSLECNDEFNSGMAAFKNLNNPIITIEYSGVAAGDVGKYTFYCVHKFWQIIESDPSQKVLFTKVQT